jgi:hypothetical protein
MARAAVLKTFKMKQAKLECVSLVIPAKAGIQYLVILPAPPPWMPVFTGMTDFV